MVVHYLRLARRPARNVFCRRNFSNNPVPRKGGALRWAFVGGAFAAGSAGTIEYFYPATITDMLPAFLKPGVVAQENKIPAGYLENATRTANSLPSETVGVVTAAKEPKPQEVLTVVEESVTEEPKPAIDSSEPPKKKKKKRKKKKEAEPEPVVVDSKIEPEPVTVEAAKEPEPVIVEAVKEAEPVVVEAAKEPEPAVIEATKETEPAVIEAVAEVVAEAESVIAEPEPVLAAVDETVESPPQTEELSVLETAEEEPAAAVGPDETEMILEALNTLDYEPVLSDTVLELLVGKAANREKAVVATVSRLENAMATVVNEVQRALAHHNVTSALVSAAKVSAQSISEATDKDEAKNILSKLVESSAAVGAALSEGEEIDAAVVAAFNRLNEIIIKAEQFNLKNPVAAARALLSKSRHDYYESCQTAQEHQVDHALLAHYQKSVDNRKKVLESELEILREHFPKQHTQLNATFDAAANHRAAVDELNTLITYLSNKVGRLERELDEQRESELSKLKMVVEAQKLEDAKILEERLKVQKEQLKYQYEVQQQTEIENAVAAARDESARLAERQQEILSAELQEKTEQQIRDLTAFWSDEAALRESCVETEYQCKLEKANALLLGVGDMLDTQNQRYRQTLAHRRLLNLATDIFQTVNSGSVIDLEQLQGTLETLKLEFNEDPVVSAVASSIPHSFVSTSFSQLNNRLEELDSACRKTALVTDPDSGIGSHILSRAMSFLTLRDNTYDTKPEDGGSITLYYLYKAQNEMKQNNLDTATRYLNQLVGKPKLIVKDWLIEARSLLELRQSASVLLNYAKMKNNEST